MTAIDDLRIDVQVLPPQDRSDTASTGGTGGTGRIASPEAAAGLEGGAAGTAVRSAPGLSSDRPVEETSHRPSHLPGDASPGSASSVARSATDATVAGARPLLLGVTGLCVLVLAGVAGAVSFDHMRELAAAHGQTGWKAYAFPVSVDGLEVVAGLYLVAQRRAGHQTGWLPWAALALGAAASMAANVAVGGHDPLGKALAGWPALSLLVTLKLLFTMLEHTAPPRPAPTGPVIGPDVPDGPVIVPDSRDEHRTVPSLSAVPGSTPGALPGPSAAGVRVVPNQGPVATGAEQDAVSGRGRAVDFGPVPGDRARPVDASTVTGLLPAARRAREALACKGLALSRDALADTMRRDGQALSNARASLLLKILRAEDVPRLHTPSRGDAAT